MDDRKVLLSLIKQNTEQINGIVKSNSEENRIIDNEKLVNMAINFCFCADSDIYYVKDFRYKVDNLSLLRLYVLQNDILEKMFSVKKIDFKLFLKDCYDMTQDFRYSEKYCDAFETFDYPHLVNTRKEFMFRTHSAPQIKPPTKQEIKSITEEEKYKTLHNITKKAYDIYEINVDNINNKHISFEKFIENLNFGSLDKSFKEYMSKVLNVSISTLNQPSIYSKDKTIQRIENEQKIKNISNQTLKLENIINKENTKEKVKMENNEIEIIDMQEIEDIAKELNEENNEYTFDENGQGLLPF